MPPQAAQLPPCRRLRSRSTSYPSRLCASWLLTATHSQVVACQQLRRNRRRNRLRPLRMVLWMSTCSLRWRRLHHRRRSPPPLLPRRPRVTGLPRRQRLPRLRRQTRSRASARSRLHLRRRAATPSGRPRTAPPAGRRPCPTRLHRVRHPPRWWTPSWCSRARHLHRPWWWPRRRLWPCQLHLHLLLRPALRRHLLPARRPASLLVRPCLHRSKPPARLRCGPSRRLPWWCRSRPAALRLQLIRRRCRRKSSPLLTAGALSRRQPRRQR